jgi:hypothetical protein
MPAKNNRRSAGRNFQCTFAAHLEANQRADEWAMKCLAYRAAGKAVRAKYAERKARHWLKRARTLEAKVTDPPRTGGRA